MRRIVLLVRTTGFKGNLGSIIKNFEAKKAKFVLFDIPEEEEEDQIFELLCLIRDCMMYGIFLLLNIDSLKFNYEFLGGPELTDVLDLKFLNRDKESIVKKFIEFGVDPPEYIHPNFLVILCGAKKIVITEEDEKSKESSDSLKPTFTNDYKDRLLKRYPWLNKLERLTIGAIKSLKNDQSIYETALIEDSFNFANQLGY